MPARSGLRLRRRCNAQAAIAPRRPAIPANVHPIDAFLTRYAKAKGVPLPPLVSDAIFVRCAYLDLTGLLPSRKSRMLSRERLS
jgi:hypothetical protein